MRYQLLAVLTFVAFGSLSGCSNKEEEAKAASATKLAAQQAEAEAKRIAALTPEQKAKEKFERACTQAKAQFAECQQRTGDAYVNCIASMKDVPEGCGQTDLKDMYDHANGSLPH